MTTSRTIVHEPRVERLRRAVRTLEGARDRAVSPEMYRLFDAKARSARARLQLDRPERTGYHPRLRERARGIW